MNTLGLNVSGDKERESESDKRSLSNNRKPNREKK